MEKTFDIVIVGGGPAGLTAGIYAARGGLSALIIEKGGIGGQAALTAEIENYPALKKMSGMELTLAMMQQAEQFGVEFLYDEVTAFELSSAVKTLKTVYSGDILAKTVILCMGAHARLLDVPGEMKFAGRGVSYCAVCDGAFFKGKDVAVVGGGNTAVEDAMYLTRFAKSVTLVHRRDSLRACQLLSDRIKSSSVNILWDSVISEIEGGDKVASAKIKNVKTGEVSSIALDGIFVAVGQIPAVNGVKDLVSISENGYILADQEMKTSIPGVFAAGDIIEKPLRQIVTAAGDGAVAAESAIKYLDF